MDPIWNADENRPKAVFRLCCQFLIFLLLNFLAVFIVSRLSANNFSNNFSPLISLLALTSMVVSVCLAGKFLDNRPFTDFGFHLNCTWWLDLIFGLFLGAILISLVFIIEITLGWIIITGPLAVYTNHLAFTHELVNSIIVFIAVGIQEETFSRGYHLRNIAEGITRPQIKPLQALILGWVISSILFGLFHTGNPHATIVSTIFIALAGLFLGLGFIFTGELAIPIGIHITWNYFQGTVFGFPVSGKNPIFSFLTTHQSGPILWTGGDFGPEAGLLSLLVILMGCGVILFWLRLTNRPLKPADTLAVFKVNRGYYESN